MRSEGADRETSNELFDETSAMKKRSIQLRHPAAIRDAIGDRFLQRVRSTWFGGLLRWRARTSYHTDSGFHRNACANSHPVSNFCAAHPAAPVRWIGFTLPSYDVLFKVGSRIDSIFVISRSNHRQPD